MFKKVRDWDDETFWQSEKLSNGEFDYWLIIELVDVKHLIDFPEKYSISIMAVAPSQVPEETRDSNLSSLGLNDDEWEVVEKEPEGADMALFLCEAGCGANLWHKEGNNKQKLYQDAKKQAILTTALFGLYMDKWVNQVGTTGWDMLKGDIMAGWRRLKEQQNDRQADQSERVEDNGVER